MRLPRAVRDAVARLVLDAMHDREARRCLRALARAGGDWSAVPEPRRPRPSPLADTGEMPSDLCRRHAAAVAERAWRATRAIGRRACGPRHPPIAVALEQADALFAAGLYFEAHELLESHWTRAREPVRTVLQGVIQIAVGLEHLANGNPAGARSLLRTGAGKLRQTQAIGKRAVRFICALDRLAEGLDPRAPARFDPRQVPRFPIEALKEFLHRRGARD